MKIDINVARCLARLSTGEFTAYRQYIDALYTEALKESATLLDAVHVRRAQGKALVLEKLATELKEGANILQKITK